MTPPAALRAAIVQDVETSQVLMLGWMDDEALAKTNDTGYVHFYSRSRHRLWQKGETSGNVLRVEQVTPDCDGDALLVKVTRSGPVCHTGSVSCFTPWLWRRVLERARGAPDPGSYVSRLVNDGVPACARKVGEEALEVMVAALVEDDRRLVAEFADLWFHCYVLLAARGLDPSAVEEELTSRAGRIARAAESPR
jgi:phosphoribosyl-ATP pyrophosphohydrolase/phosphoribosyl-AMP cyclohydrolase